jgi:hypothetical protein
MWLIRGLSVYAVLEGKIALQPQSRLARKRFWLTGRFLRAQFVD